MSELSDVIEFRNRLVAYMNIGLKAKAGGYYDRPTITPDEEELLQRERPWLTQEYGRLYRVINRWGATSMGSPALGTTTIDVVADAITGLNKTSYVDICRFAEQHIDTVIGRLRDQEERRGADTAERFYRATSFGYWLRQLILGIRWLFATTARSIVTILGAVALAILTAFVSGWAQAMFSSPR